MAIPLKVPSLGESVTQATVGAWLKREGDPVEADEPLVEVESEKATVALPAPAAGVLRKVLRNSGDTVAVGETIGELEEGAAAGAEAASFSTRWGPSRIRRRRCWSRSASRRARALPAGKAKDSSPAHARGSTAHSPVPSLSGSASSSGPATRRRAGRCGTPRSTGRLSPPTPIAGTCTERATATGALAIPCYRSAT